MFSSFLPAWGFRATKTINKTDNPTQLTQKNGEKTDLNDIVIELPSLSTTSKLILHPLLFNGVLQTMYYGSSGGQEGFKVWYGRELFSYKNGGISSLDWVIEEEAPELFKGKYNETLPENWPRLFPRTRFFTAEELENLKNNSSETKPLVVILHGLAGGSHEPLVRNFAELLTSGKNKDKFDVVVSLSRGCGRTKVTSGHLFNALSSTDDIHEVLLEMKNRYPNRPIYAVGFSFGALTLLNYLGTYANESSKLLKAAAIVGCPFDLGESTRFIESSWSGAYLFNKSILAFLNKLVKNNLNELNKYEPELFNKENLAITMAAKETRVFDEVFTSKSAGLNTADEYYKTSSSLTWIPQVKVPLLSISSSDDPTIGKFIPTELLKQNPNIVSVVTDLGGHLAFVTPSKQFWSVRVIDEFLEAMETTL